VVNFLEEYGSCFLSLAAYRTKALSRPLNWFGIVIAVVGLVSVVPALNAFSIVFGLLQIVWFTWVGIVLLRTSHNAAE